MFSQVFLSLVFPWVSIPLAISVIAFLWALIVSMKREKPALGVGGNSYAYAGIGLMLDAFASMIPWFIGLLVSAFSFFFWVLITIIITLVKVYG